MLVLRRLGRLAWRFRGVLVLAAGIGLLAWRTPGGLAGLLHLVRSKVNEARARANGGGKAGTDSTTGPSSTRSTSSTTSTAGHTLDIGSASSAGTDSTTGPSSTRSSTSSTSSKSKKVPWWESNEYAPEPGGMTNNGAGSCTINKAKYPPTASRAAFWYMVNVSNPDGLLVWGKCQDGRCGYYPKHDAKKRRYIPETNSLLEL